MGATRGAASLFLARELYYRRGGGFFTPDGAMVHQMFLLNAESPASIVVWTGFIYVHSLLVQVSIALLQFPTNQQGVCHPDGVASKLIRVAICPTSNQIPCPPSLRFFVATETFINFLPRKRTKYIVGHDSYSRSESITIPLQNIRKETNKSTPNHLRSVETWKMAALGPDKARGARRT